MKEEGMGQMISEKKKCNALSSLNSLSFVKFVAER